MERRRRKEEPVVGMREEEEVDQGHFIVVRVHSSKSKFRKIMRISEGCRPSKDVLDTRYCYVVDSKTGKDKNPTFF